MRQGMPWLGDEGKSPQETLVMEELMEPPVSEQFLRATDCILCQCCFSDCPKRREDDGFLGPATLLAEYKRYHHPQEASPEARLRRAAEPGGVFDCDRHGFCTRVCPKDCRPMSAIILLDRQARKEGLGPEGQN
jgi:succinate dehydrogenase / fumarate reductase iron-sulfur subunit